MVWPLPKVWVIRFFVRCCVCCVSCISFVLFFCINAPGLSQEVLALRRCLPLLSSFAGLAGKPAKATCDEEAPAERTQLMRRGQGPPVLTYSRLPSKRGISPRGSE